MTIDEVLQKIKNENIKTVIFDFDNTICDMVINWKPWHHAVGEIFKKYEPSYSKHLSGGQVQDDQNYFLEKYGTEINRQIIQTIREKELKNSTGCNPLKHIIYLIKKLNDVELWIWSSNHKDTVKKYLTDLGIADRFSKLITRDFVDFIKPDPNGFLKAAGENANRNEYLMIGNSNNDKNAAENAGISYIDEKDIEV